MFLYVSSHLLIHSHHQQPPSLDLICLLFARITNPKAMSTTSPLLRGKRRYFYQPAVFPWVDYVRKASVKQEAHFVLSEMDLREGFVSLGDFQAGNDLGEVKLTLLCFLAEAIHYSQKYRGIHHGSTFVGGNPRVVVVMNYLTKEVFLNGVDKKPYTRDELCTLDNIRGALVSIFICDNDLSFDDMCTDMMNINARGIPHMKSRQEVIEVEEEDRQRAEQQPNQQQPAQPPQQQQAGGVPHIPAPRPDQPGLPLGDRKSKYYFTGDPMQKQRFRDQYKRMEDSSFLNVDSLNPLLLLIQCWTHTFNYVPEQVSDSHMSCLGPAHEYQIQHAFSFLKAIEEMKLMPIAEIFKDPDNWVNTRRGPVAEETFGSPCFEAAVAIPDIDAVPQRRFQAGTVPTALLMPADLFRANRIQDTILPHFRIDDDNLGANSRSVIRLRNNEHKTINTTEVLESVGIMSSYRKQQKKKEEEMNRDIFNEIFERVSAEEQRIYPKLGNPQAPSSAYLSEMKVLREKGHRLYLSLISQVASFTIPEGFRHLLSWRLTQATDLTPLPEHMWQNTETGLTSYGQMKHRHLILTEAIVRTSDTQLFLFPVVWRAAMSAYLPKVGNKLFKEHIQIICAPGTSKSDLLNRVTELLIPYTYDVEGGASGMGLVGEHCSQRLIDISHELDNYYAPVEEPKGENAKIHKMLLGCLSEGRKKYKTTVEAIDPLNGEKIRASNRKESDDTTVRIGARNHNTFMAKSGGSAAAMYDRFTQVMQVQIYSAKRVSIFSQVLDVSTVRENASRLLVQQQFRMAQDFVGRYCIAVECGWLPFPDLSLFSDLAPKMTSFMAARYPHFHSQLRRVGGMATRLLGDLVWDRALKVLFTPLNPTHSPRYYDQKELDEMRSRAEIENRECTSIPWVSTFAPYDPERLLPEMAKMMYCTYESLIFVMTERLHEMTNASMLDVFRHIAESSANYYRYGRLSCDEEMAVWPVERTVDVSVVALTLDGLIAKLLDRKKNDKTGHIEEGAVYSLAIPSSEAQFNYQSKQKPDHSIAATELGYHQFEMRREHISPEYEELYETSAHARREPIRLRRETMPNYKIEKIKGVEWINPNYVCITGSIYSYANSMSGIFGEQRLDRDGFISMMEMASSEYMITPTLPLINRNEPAFTPEALGIIQSLRYISGVMSYFPKYRLPILIQDRRKNCFYMLISYFETNFHRMCEEMIEYISYNTTPRREILLGVPAAANRFYYQPYQMKPNLKKKLVIGGNTNIRAETVKMLSSYHFDPKTGLGPQKGRSAFESRTYDGVCIEKEKATAYLLRNFPDDPEVLTNYLPSALERRLREFYEKHPEGLIEQPYIEMCKPVEEPLREEALTFDQPNFNAIIKANREARRLQLDDEATAGHLLGPPKTTSTRRLNIGTGIADHFFKTGLPAPGGPQPIADLFDF